MDDILKSVGDLEGEMVNALINMCRIPAIAPESDGDGEAKRAFYLIELLKENGITDIEVFKAEDRRVSAGYRPNIVATIKGSEPDLPALWIVSHMDVVPVGERSKWSSEPFAPICKDGKLIGRGVEDNGQALIASLYAVKAILNLGRIPRRTVKLCFVADEEVGSAYGIKYLVEQNGLFGKDDLLLVPDFGAPDGSVIEVVEKGHLQVKVVTTGKQVHASRPNKGINAFRAASTFIDNVTSELYGQFCKEDPMFSPPNSTFEPTKKEANVQNGNTIPGEDVFYMDCRILPSDDIDEIIKVMKDVATRVEIETGATFEFNIKASKAPPATPADSPIVVNLQKAVKKVLGIDARPIGIGGGTCAAIFREKGLSAAVWSINEETAHEPDEWIWIKNLVSDSKVFALLCMS